MEITNEKFVRKLSQRDIQKILLVQKNSLEFFA